MRPIIILTLLVTANHAAPSPKTMSKLLSSPINVAEPQQLSSNKPQTSSPTADEILESVKKIQSKFEGQSSLPAAATATSRSMDGGDEESNARQEKMYNMYGFYPGPYGTAPAAQPAFASAYPSQPAAAYAAPSYSNPFYSASSAYNSIYNPLNFGTLAPVYSYNDLSNFFGYNGYDDDDYDEANDDPTAAIGTSQNENEIENDYDFGGDYYGEDIFSRTNQRRRPQTGRRNSPIFYIRLPPTPYMFVPGMGYISNPPTITPLPQPIAQPSPFASQYYSNPYMTMPQPANPYLQQPNQLIKVPVNFVSNGRPVNVYQFQGPTAGQRPYPQPVMNPIRFPGQSNYGNQLAMMPPIRQRPYRPPTNKIPNRPDSKVTHLKGPYLFNGRPEEIFLLQNLQSTPYNAIYPGFY